MFTSILHPRYKSAHRAIFLLIAASSSLALGAISVNVIPNSNSVGQYGVYELTLSHGSNYSNPWDDIVIAATFTAPSGRTYRAGGFYYDTNTWKVRFAPMETGTWSWSLTFNNGTQVYSTTGMLLCTASARKGFIRIDPASPRTGFITERDGKAFYPLGIQKGVGDWTTYPTQNGVKDGLDDWWLGDDPPQNPVTTDQYFSTLTAAGFNLFRQNGQTISQIQGGYFNISGSGKNNYNIVNGKLLDEAVQAAHKYGMHFLLAFCEDPSYFARNFDLSDPTVLQALKRFHAYMINRFGAYIDIWELMNEKSNVPDAYFAAIVPYIKQVDPYGHLVTTSHTPTSAAAQSYLDINTPHQYESVDNLQLDQDLVAGSYGIKARRAIFPSVPMIWGETGNKKPICNDDAERFRIFIWVNFFNQAYPIFWDQSYSKGYCGGLSNMYVGTQERAFSSILTRHMGDLDSGLKPLAVSATPATDVRAYGLGSGTEVGVYFVHSSSHTTTLSGANTTVTIPADNLQADWIDPATGTVLKTQAVNRGSQTLAIPAFRVDIALRIRGAGGSIQSSCDLNGDSAVDVLDVQIAINQTLGKSLCTKGDLDADGKCDVVDVQREVNAALGGACRVGP